MSGQSKKELLAAEMAIKDEKSKYRLKSPLTTIPRKVSAFLNPKSLY